MTPRIEKIRARIRQLRALAESGKCTEGEALNAAAIAARLMAEHGVSEDQVAGTQRIKIAIPLGRSVARPADELAGAIAYLTETLCWIVVGGERSVVYYGDEADVLIAEYLQGVLSGAVERGQREFRSSATYGRRRTRKTRDAAMRAYTREMVRNLRGRLAALKPGQYARIARKQAMLKNAVKSDGIDLVESKRRPSRDPPSRFDDARVAGDRAARGVAINPGLDRDTTRATRFLPDYSKTA